MICHNGRFRNSVGDLCTPGGCKKELRKDIRVTFGDNLWRCIFWDTL